MAFLEVDTAGMQRQLELAKDKPNQFRLLESMARVAAFSGNLQKARSIYRQPFEDALRARLQEAATGILAQEALTEALFGNTREAKDGAQAALHRDHANVLGCAGMFPTSPIRVVARLALARAYALDGDAATSRTAYQDFFALWKNADPDTPILQQAPSYSDFHHLARIWECSNVSCLNPRPARSVAKVRVKTGPACHIQRRLSADPLARRNSATKSTLIHNGDNCW
jgi:hypothetical protein